MDINKTSEDLIEMSNRASFYQSDVAVVLVVYNTNFQNSEAFLSLNSALQKISADIVIDLILYDNSPVATFNSETRIKNWNITYIHDLSNPGLSKASNVGYEISVGLGKKWILFINPDTTFPEDYFLTLYDALVNNRSIQLFAPILLSNNLIVSPSKFILNRGAALPHVTAGVNGLKNRSILYSGMFISTSALAKCGGFNEHIKLDFMDFYIIEKYKKIYNEFFLLNMSCLHDLSSFETDEKKILRRFGYYCEGARNYCDGLSDFLTVSCICAVRTLNLTIKFKSRAFVPVFIKKFLFATKNKGTIK
jgi:GT2 family glycosyltransferase